MTPSIISRNMDAILFSCSMNALYLNKRVTILQGGSSGRSYGKSPAEVGVKCSTDDVFVAI
jgi:hypothetical protein